MVPLLVVAVLLVCSPIAAVVCSKQLCPEVWVSATQRGDGYCDLACNSEICGFDGGDCSVNCLSELSVSVPGNSVCETESNTEVCGWDAGDCGYCASGCRR